MLLLFFSNNSISESGCNLNTAALCEGASEQPPPGSNSDGGDDILPRYIICPLDPPGAPCESAPYIPGHPHPDGLEETSPDSEGVSPRSVICPVDPQDGPCEPSASAPGRPHPEGLEKSPNTPPEYIEKARAVRRRDIHFPSGGSSGGSTEVPHLFENNYWESDPAARQREARAVRRRGVGNTFGSLAPDGGYPTGRFPSGIPRPAEGPFSQAAADDVTLPSVGSVAEQAAGKGQKK